MSSFENCLFMLFVLFLIGFGFLLVNLSNIIASDIRPLSDEKIEKHFSYSVGYLFTLMTVSFAVKKPFGLIRSQLSILAFVANAFGVLVMKFLTTPMS